jgi:DNA recombination protein RmuC
MRYLRKPKKIHQNPEQVEKKLNEKFTKEFEENLANKVWMRKRKFTSQNKINIEQILNPLQEKIKVLKTGRTPKVPSTVKILRQQIIGLKRTQRANE